jgi:ATP-dependent helicase Lhr and Lhr-like helicase
MAALTPFHSAVSAWFARSFSAPTEPQSRAWPAIQAGRHVLIAAPTGSGKTLAAFLAAIDSLVRIGVTGELADETHVVYVSPLKALSNDIQRNLDAPLAGIHAELAAQSLPDVDIRTLVRSGDTPQAERDRMRRRPPHIVVTTPESLYILLTSESGRRMLATTRTVIVDEIHAMAGNKRGVHLALSLERLEALAGRRLQRIGLSATQKPVEVVARFLVGAGGVRADGSPDGENCELIDTGHGRARDLAIEVPASPLETVMSGEVWEQVYGRLAELIAAHRTTLVFVNTRRLAERVTRHLSERLGEANVAAHHGSLAKELRLDAEARLKAGRLMALVATASLELGIDIGDVDLVCQIGTPRSIASFLQRVGRSGHAVAGTPKGRLFPLSRDELAESAALFDAVARGELERLAIPEGCLDVLAQQIAAEVAAQEWDEDALFARFRRAWPYRALSRDDFDDVLRMLAEGAATRRGRRGALIHRDAIHRRLRGRRGARLAALTSGGTIPDNADYRVVLEPESRFVGTVNEDFAVESLAGDVFQLGNSSYRIQRVERGVVRVEDAHGQPPNIPFWLGEAPARSDELSRAVSRLRAAFDAFFCDRRESLWGKGIDPQELLATLAQIGIDEPAARQLVDYFAAAKAALGVLPTQERIVFERFFDETGGMQLVIHSPWGGRINRAWGLALRKRFCRKFNFELQAAATENSIVLSLTGAHSFALDEVARYLHSASVRPLLIQAVLDAPMFMARWRWNAAIALALPRFRGGHKVPPQLQRMDAEDLIAAVFPDQLACGENVVGDREVPDHPLVTQTVRDCLEEAMDIAGLEALLRGIEAGTIEVVARDLTEPSPLALEVLAARPYAYLDDAPLEERRTQAVMSRRWLDPESAADIGRLDPEAIERVRAEAWPDARTADELHDALLSMGAMTAAEAQASPAWLSLLDALAGDGRATRLRDTGTSTLWAAAERWPLLRAVYPHAVPDPELALPAAEPWTREDAIRELVRGRLEALGPVDAAALAGALALPRGEIDAALAALETEGFALRGRFTPDARDTEWCERGLLARIHRYTVKRLRAEIEPVSARDYLRFLCDWQRVSPAAHMEGPDAVAAVIAQLEGFEAPAAAWETEILPARVNDYDPAWLDDLCRAGRVVWARLSARRNGPERVAVPVRTTPITLLTRRDARVWKALAEAAAANTPPQPSPRGQLVADYIGEHGASFFEEIVDGTHLLRSQVEDALAELVALGLVNSDSFSGLRALLVPSDKRRPYAGGRRKRRTVLFGMEDAGRWALLRPRRERDAGVPTDAGPEAIEHVARTLLRRYGVVFWRVLEREAAWLPPWRDLLRSYRRLEARGEIRGGRFVAGFSGEQFALPDGVGALREVRRHADAGTAIALSGADPLNLVGVLTPGARLAALTGNRLLFREGIPLAVLAAGDERWLETLEDEERWQAHNLLVRRHVPPVLADLS